jgi:hypothetical protein
MTPMKTLRLSELGLALALALGAPAACSSGDETPSGSGAGKGGSTGGSAGVGGASGGNAGSAGSGGSGGVAGAGATAGGGSGGSGDGGGAAGTGGAPPGAFDLVAIGANTTIGLEWNAISGAESYNVYWSANPGVTTQTGQRVPVTAPNWVHRGLTNGSAIHYVVTAISGGSEGAPSSEASATPAGEWVLEEFGTGVVLDVRSANTLPKIPIEKRLHILLFGEGYTAADLPVLHALTSHDGNRANDVDRWVDLVFGIEPYKTFRQAFVVWYLPRASGAHIGGDTAFDVPVIEGPGVGQVTADGETARQAWEAIAAFRYPPTDFGGPSSGTARNVVTPFLMFDPARGRASVSGRATSLRNPASTNQRVSACFGVGHAHEFTHAFSSLRDEYLEDDNTAPTQWSGTANVVGSNSCGELPWQHLLSGGTINPGRDQLVGAFGRPQHGYHSELLCLLNGTHDNAAYYGGDGLLRVEDRMCNFCREITAFRVYQRASVLASGDAGFMSWTQEYRSAFFSRFPFAVPAVVPQTNNVRNPSQGTAVWEACSAASAADQSESPRIRSELRNRDRRPAGCVLDPE